MFSNRLKAAFVLSIIWCFSTTVPAQVPEMDNHPIISLLGKKLNKDQIESYRNIAGVDIWKDNNTDCIYKVKLTMLKGKGNKKYKGDFPFCPDFEKIRKRLYLNCLGDTKWRQSTSEYGYEQPIIIENKYKLISFGSYKGAAGMEITLTDKYYQEAVRMSNMPALIAKINARKFDPKIHTIPTGNDLPTFEKPMGQQAFHVAGSTDHLLVDYYEMLARKKTISAPITHYNWYPEWDYMDVVSFHDASVTKKVTTLDMGLYTDLHLSKRHGIIISSQRLHKEFPLNISKSNNFGTLIPQLFQQSEVSRIKYLNHQTRHMRVVAEIKTEHGMKYLEMIQKADGSSQVDRFFVHAAKPLSFDLDNVWTPLVPGTSPWNVPFAESGEIETPEATKVAYKNTIEYSRAYIKNTKRQTQFVKAEIAGTFNDWEDVSRLHKGDPDYNLNESQVLSKLFDLNPGIYLVVFVTDNSTDQKMEISGLDAKDAVPLPPYIGEGKMKISAMVVNTEERSKFGVRISANKNSLNNLLHIERIIED